MAYQTVNAVPSAARTATGNGQGMLNADPGDQLALQVIVTAVSGTTPTLDLAVQWSHDGATWSAPETPDSFTQITTASSKVKTFGIKGPFYRVVWTIGGTTPSFTFSVSAYTTT